MSLKASGGASLELDRNVARELWDSTIQSEIGKRRRMIVTEVLRRAGDDFLTGFYLQFAVSESCLMWARTRPWILWIEVSDQKSQ